MKALDTIKKLLTLANDDGATEGEVQAALSRAAHLAAKHNLSDVEIERAVRADGTEGVRLNVNPRDMVREVIFSKGKLFRWDKWLARAVAKATCTGHYVGWDSRPALFLYGLPQDVAVGRELFAFARTAMGRCARNWAREQRQAGLSHVQGNHPAVRTYKDGFCRGLIEAAKLPDAEEEKARIEVGEGCTALVLVTDIVKVKREALALKGKAIGLMPGRSLGGSTWGGQDAYGAGKSAGRATSLKKDVIT